MNYMKNVSNVVVLKVLCVQLAILKFRRNHFSIRLLVCCESEALKSGVYERGMEAI